MSRLNVDGVIFDLGSTLLEYENIPWEKLNLDCFGRGYEFLKKQGLSIPEEKVFRDRYISVRGQYRDRANQTWQEYVITDAIGELLKLNGLTSPDGLADKFFEAFYEPVARQLSIFADSVSVLTELKKRGKKIGLISNTIFPAEYHLREMKNYGLLEHFDFTIFSSSFGWRKPHPAIFNHALEKISLPAEKTLYVGDRYIEDYMGPTQIGMKAIIKYRAGREYPQPWPPEIIVVKSLSEILLLL